MNGTIVITIAVFIALIYLKVLEAAFSEININKIKHAADDGNEKSIAIFKHTKKIEGFKATIKLVVVLMMCAVIFLSIYLLLQIMGGGEVLLPPYEKNEFLCIFGGIVLIAVIILLFGGLITEKIGVKRSDDIVFSTIGFVSILSIILSPITFVLTSISNFLCKIFGVDNDDDVDSITEEEIRLLMDSSEGTGAIDDNEKEMINNIFEFNNTIVDDIATHRTDIIAVSLAASLEEIIEVIKNEKFSRIPVFDENIDDIIGFFRVRDLLKFYTDGSGGNKFRLNDIILEPYFVPFSKKTDELFEDMQKDKVQMAIVIDEYGGTAGIVTMEDLIEEIMGNIFDEYDEEEEEIRRIDENTFLLMGTTEIDDVEDALGIEFDNCDDYDTIGGFLIGQLGRIPEDEERPKIVIGDLVFKVEKIVDKRIEFIKVHKNLDLINFEPIYFEKTSLEQTSLEQTSLKQKVLDQTNVE